MNFSSDEVSCVVDKDLGQSGENPFLINLQKEQSALIKSQREINDRKLMFFLTLLILQDCSDGFHLYPHECYLTSQKSKSPLTHFLILSLILAAL